MLYMTTQSYIGPITPQDNTIKLKVTPGWEEVLELFSSVTTVDMTDNVATQVVTTADDIILSDFTERERQAFRALFSFFNLTDNQTKDVVKQLTSSIDLRDTLSKELSLSFDDYLTFQDKLSFAYSRLIQSNISLTDYVNFYKPEFIAYSTLALVDNIQFIVSTGSRGSSRPLIVTRGDEVVNQSSSGDSKNIHKNTGSSRSETKSTGSSEQSIYTTGSDKEI